MTTWQLDVRIRPMRVGESIAILAAVVLLGLASPAQYVEAHPARLPPPVTWTVLMLLKRLWLVLLLIGLGSMALVAWRRGSPTKSSQQPHEEDQ